MKNKVKHFFLQGVGCFLTMITVSSINSMCFLFFGQEKEPETLKRLKK